MSPRRNQRPRRDNRRVVIDTSTPQLTPQQMARNLVLRGLASSAILGPTAQAGNRAPREQPVDSEQVTLS